LKKENVATVVERLLTPVVEEMGYRLWDVVFHKVGADPTLTITIDNDEGITIEDCERVHRAIDPLLDEADPIETAYRLEVSSPGIERAITRPEHYAAMKGSEVEVKLYAPIDGVKLFRGILGDFDGERVTFTVGGEDITLEREKLARVRTVYDF
jgi:ribosome maturation factor RimP